MVFQIVERLLNCRSELKLLLVERELCKCKIKKAHTSHLFLKALKESDDCGLGKHSVVDHYNCSSCTLSEDAFASPADGKGIYRCPICGTRYCLLKCKGVHKAEKGKV